MVRGATLARMSDDAPDDRDQLQALRKENWSFSVRAMQLEERIRKLRRGRTNQRLNLAGLGLSLIGTVLIGVASFLGPTAGYASQNAGTPTGWTVASGVGWALLAGGFVLQLLAAVSARRH
jgi:hypothetical protein